MPKISFEFLFVINLKYKTHSKRLRIHSPYSILPHVVLVRMQIKGFHVHAKQKVDVAWNRKSVGFSFGLWVCVQKYRKSHWVRWKSSMRGCKDFHSILATTHAVICEHRNVQSAFLCDRRKMIFEQCEWIQSHLLLEKQSMTHFGTNCKGSKAWINQTIFPHNSSNYQNTKS